ncbi:hypothetical protein E4U39_005531 [Claviceps sp. Clav50 group G5]|nr:hypothetical protein E4U39_005531 [Claviceps sp. Clav50 group G5]
MADGDGNGQRWGHPSKKQRFRLLVWLFVAFVAVTVVSSTPAVQDFQTPDSISPNPVDES